MSFRSIADRIFGIDTRSLALMRILLGSIVLTELFHRVHWFSIFYGEHSIVSSEAQDAAQYFSTWTLHAGSETYVLFLIGIQFITGLSLLIGFQTRLATIVTWALLLSLDFANRMIMPGGEILLRALLLIGVFLPLGTVWSVDAFMRDKTQIAPRRHLSTWTAALMIQMGCMYLFAGLHKLNPTWESGLGPYYALHLQGIATQAGVFIREFPTVLYLSNFSVVYLELAAVMFLFFPFRTSTIRIGIVSLLALMHISFNAFLHIELFTFISLAGLCAFIPTSLWDRYLPHTTQSSPSLLPPLRRRNPALSTTVELLGLFTAIVIVSSSTGSYMEKDFRSVVPGSGFFMNELGLQQKWNMFAFQKGVRSRVTYEFWGVFESGKSQDLTDPALLTDGHWRKLFERFDVSLADRYAVILCREWNAPNTYAEKVSSVVVKRRSQLIPLPGQPYPDWTEEVLTSSTCP